MRQKSQNKENNVLIALFCVMLSAFGVLQYAGVGFKAAAILAGAGMVALLCKEDLSHVWNFPSVLLIGYVAFSTVSALWAVSGKFFLREYARIFIALFVFLFVVLRRQMKEDFAKKIATVIAGTSTLYAILSVEAATTGLTKTLLQSMESMAAVQMGFAGRLFGVFGNPNIESSFYAIGIIFSLALISEAERKAKKFFWLVAHSIIVYAFILGISIGATACFAAAVIVYLVFAGNKRNVILLYILQCLVPALVSSFFAAGCFGNADLAFIPLLLMFATAGATLALETLTERYAVTWLNAHQSMVYRTMLALVLLGAVYLVLGLNLAGPYTFKSGGQFSRSIVLEPGEYSMRIEVDGRVHSVLYSMDRIQVTTGEVTWLYDGANNEYRFQVPENSEICTLMLQAEKDVTVYSATINGTRQIKLHYWLLPEYVAHRFQNVWLNSSQLMRETYVWDALKLFRQRPIFGYGVGAFETAVTSVQEFPYESKYAHNHYAQILVESGIIGFALFVGSLVTMAVALWKSHKRMQESELAWLYPALCAEFVMSTLQMFWDVSMSVTVFACMIYTLYGLIVSTCAEPLVLKKATEQELTTGEKKKAAANPESDTVIRLACSILPLLFIMSVGLNIYAQKLIREPVESIDEFMSNLTRAAKMDLYEHNDIKMSYVQTAMQSDDEGVYREQADEYAQQLSKVQSNSIPYYLVVYYLNTQQYDLAIEEAKTGARYSASDSDTWNNMIDAFKQIFVDSGEYSPLLNDDGTLLRGLTEYHDMLEARDARSLKPIALNENSVAFFDKLAQLNDCNGDTEAMYAVLTALPEG